MTRGARAVARDAADGARSRQWARSAERDCPLEIRLSVGYRWLSRGI
jgi:hypothetical protein